MLATLACIGGCRPVAPVPDRSDAGVAPLEEAPPRPEPANAVPRYPPMMLDLGASGEVHVRYVVDTTGLVDPRSFEVLTSTHDLFAHSVRRVLPLWRFSPALRAGRPVAATREERFVFRAPSDPDRPELESVVLARDTAPDGVPRTVIGPPPPDPAAAAAFTADELLAVQRAAVLEVATSFGDPAAGGAPRTVCVALDHAGERVEADAASLAWLGATDGRAFVAPRDCPPTHASMILLVDSLDRPVRRGPPGWVDPLRVAVLLVRPWTRDVAYVQVTAEQGLGGRVYECTIARAEGDWAESCVFRRAWVH